MEHNVKPRGGHRESQANEGRRKYLPLKGKQKQHDLHRETTTPTTEVSVAETSAEAKALPEVASNGKAAEERKKSQSKINRR